MPLLSCISSMSSGSVASSVMSPS
ncbi:hypothetical protein LEMLEM_LOCUS26786 [Lemmus lemmus]